MFLPKDEATRYYMEARVVGISLERCGQGHATREKVRSLADKMTELSMSFSRTVQDDVRKISVDDPMNCVDCRKTISFGMA